MKLSDKLLLFAVLSAFLVPLVVPLVMMGTAFLPATNEIAAYIIAVMFLTPIILLLLSDKYWKKEWNEKLIQSKSEKTK